MSLYCYAVVPASTALPLGLTGLGGQPLEILSAGPLAVVYSSIAGRIRPQRSNLAIHQKVLTDLCRTADVLPMSFGTLADDAAGITDLIRSNAEPLAEALARVGGKVEMTLRLSLAVENAFAHLVSVDPDLREARDAMLAVPSHENKVSVGRLFENKLAQLRDQAAETVSSHLDPVIAETKNNPPRSEKQVLALSLLIGRDSQDAFDAAVARAAEAFDDNYTFEISGPWPPQSFVDVRLDASEIDNADEAAEAALSEVKAAAQPSEAA